MLRTLTLRTNGEITSDAFASGNGGNVAVTLTEGLSIDGIAESSTTGITGITSNAFGRGNAGIVTVNAASLAITNGSEISASTFGAGAGGDVMVTAAGNLLINGGASPLATGIFSLTAARNPGGGKAGSVTVTAGDLTILINGEISSSTFGSGSAGSVLVSVPGGTLTIDGTSAIGLTGISSASATSSGKAGTVTVTAGTS